MSSRIEPRTYGGKALEKHLYELKKKGSEPPKHLLVGFFKSAKYPDGTPVAAVAMYNEFGTDTIPERPFFRRAIREAEPELERLGRKSYKRDRDALPVVDEKLRVMGVYLQGKVQQVIVQLRQPPNRPETIDRKGSSNPLIDTGAMRTAVSWQVEQSDDPAKQGRVIAREAGRGE